jgi:small subunit ribosomal protein S17
MKGRNIGYGIPVPSEPTEVDNNDPFYGSLRIKRGNFTGKVVSAKASRTAIIVIDRQIFDKKYDRYSKTRSRISVHNPASINAKEGDVVRVHQTRPISKTKHHVIVQVIGQYIDIKGQDLGAEKSEGTHESNTSKNN